ncbi:M28 family metallopeptidase [Catellatospora coxensis]|nr:M28 family peptidase [Catellatospora coxensis]
MLAIVNRLAAAEFTGRRTGTPGGHAAAAWLAQQLRQAGATVTLDPFPVRGSIRELHATPHLRYTDTTRTHALIHRRDFCEHLATTDLPQPVTGPITRPEDDPRGAWILLDDGYDLTLAQAAAKHGALGLLVSRGTDADGWMPKMIAGPATGPLPVLAVHTDWHHRMRASRGQITASAPLRTVDAEAVNVYATFATVGRSGPKVLLTAHYDGVGDDPEQRFPAAADNASGVAAVIETARQLIADHTAFTLTVALLDAEEAGAHGSAHHAPQVPEDTIVINLDGAAALHEAAAVEAAGPAHALLAALDRAGRDTGVPLRGQAMPSDNRRYAAAGLAAVGIGMGMPGYQTPAETPDRVQPATLLAATRLLTATVKHHVAGHESSQR